MRFSISWGVIATLVASSLTFGQFENLDLDKPISEQLIRRPTKSRDLQALEGPVDPASYILGPGDVLEFNVWGGIEVSYELTVSPDGTIGVPSVGEIAVAGKSLKEAHKELLNRCKTIYPKADISLRLLRVRMVKVSISGAVVEPGMYELTSVDRLSSLIFAAGGFYQEEEEDVLIGLEGRRVEFLTRKEDALNLGSPELDEPLPSMRNILITQKDGETRSVDYLRYRRNGVLDYNPVLEAGDHVHIPVIDREIGVLHIFGAVKIPGEYEFVNGDRITDLTEIAGGFMSDAQTDDIRLIRFRDGAGNYDEFKIDLNSLQPGSNHDLLQADDRVFVRKKVDFRPKHYVSINGEVNYPGIYPIEDNTTALSEIIEACGGFTDYADLSGAGILRWSLADEPDPEFERLRLIMVADMTEMEYEYFKTRSREEIPKVVAEFTKLFNDGDREFDITLRNKDEINIPTVNPTVRVTGNVIKPGVVKHVPGVNYEYYIEKAGGLSYNARVSKRRLIKAHTGVWVDLKKDTPIEIGDTIFIPAKQDINYWELYKDLLLVVSQIATILLVVRSL